MVAAHGVASLEEVIVNDAAVLIVPCDVDSIPFAVVHFDICPHMCLIAACTADKRAGNAEFVAKDFQRFGIALADELALSVEEGSGGVSFSSIAQAGCRIIVVGIVADIVVNVLERVVSRLSGLNCAPSRGNAAVDGFALAVRVFIGGVGRDGKRIDLNFKGIIGRLCHTGVRNAVGVVSDPENFRMIETECGSAASDAPL